MKINTALAALTRPIAGLLVDPSNVRAHTPKNIEAIVASLAKFGQQKPIVVNKENVVVAGNGTLEAAVKMGASEIAALLFDGDSKAFEAAYAIADNRTAELAEWDFPALSAQLKGLADDGHNLIELGWDRSELDLLLKAEWTPPGEEDLPGTTARGRHGVAPIIVSQDQREAFERCCGIIRANLDEDVSEQRCFSVVVEEFLAGHTTTN